MLHKQRPLHLKQASAVQYVYTAGLQLCPCRTEEPQVPRFHKVSCSPWWCHPLQMGFAVNLTIKKPLLCTTMSYYSALPGPVSYLLHLHTYISFNATSGLMIKLEFRTLFTFSSTRGPKNACTVPLPHTDFPCISPTAWFSVHESPCVGLISVHAIPWLIDHDLPAVLQVFGLSSGLLGNRFIARLSC